MKSFLDNGNNYLYLDRLHGIGYGVLKNDIRKIKATEAYYECNRRCVLAYTDENRDEINRRRREAYARKKRMGIINTPTSRSSRYADVDL